MALPPLPRRPSKIFHSPGAPINDDDEIYTDFTEEEEMYHQFLKINGTPEDEGKDSGVYSTEEFCKSKLMGDINLGDIIRCVNTGDPREASEMITHIHTCTIPEAVSSRDLETLAQLLDCDHKAIETRVSRLMSEVLLELDTKRHHYTNLLSCLRILFAVLQKRAMKPESMHRIQPVVILVLLVLHHQCLNHPDREQISVATRDTLQTYIDITERLGVLDTTPTLLDLRLSMQMALTGLHDVLIKAKMSHLQLGNFSEELRNDSHRKRLSKEFSKMSILEHYSLVFGVMIQISKFPVSVETLDFLRLCIESVLDFYKKSKLEKQIYGLLLLTTRAIIYVLEKPHMKHILHSTKGSLQDKLCGILEMIVSSPKIRKDVRQALQDEVTVILFHESGPVVQRVTGILDKKTSTMLNETLLIYLTRSLESLNFSSHSSPMGDSNLKWYSLQGCIVGHLDVTTHVFLPSLDTIQNGTFDLDKYHHSAMKVAHTAEHFNTLKALRKMSAYGPSEHVQRLLAFQTEPLPMFYVTETLPEITLSHHLLMHRKNRKWISEKKLALVSLGAVKALRFVHDAGFIHRNITATSFRYRNQTAVLSDFSIVKTSRTQSHGFGENNIQAAGEIPIRWSPYESLCEDEFTCASDVWMYGQLLYEIFTHGCHPYTDLYAYDLDDVMEMVLFHDLKPKWYPCIPRAIHEVIKGCVRTPPRERMCLLNAEEAIERWLKAPISQAPHSGEITFSSRKNLYPELNQLQKDTPERGTTLKLRQLKSIGGDAKSLYYNGLQNRKIPTDSLQITERALAAPDRPLIRKEGIYLHVEEPVTQRFIDGPLSGMKSDEEFAKKQHIVNFPPQKKPRECTHDSGLSHTLLYRCFDGECLLDIATKNTYGDPLDSENELEYANIIKEAVLFVSDMHKMNWIIRDICCSTLFKSKTKGKVFMPRLGRFLMCPSPEGYVKDPATNTDDRRNWMPIDVIQDKTYSMASDVYMLAMAIYEFYTAASVARDNPLENRLNTVPFATVAPEKLLDSLYRAEIPNQPEACPEWLYRLMKPCWSRDPTQRPTAHILLASMESVMLTEVSDNVSEFSCGNSSFGTNSARSTYATISSFNSHKHLHSRQPSQNTTYDVSPNQTAQTPDGYIHTVYEDSGEGAATTDSKKETENMSSEMLKPSLPTRCSGTSSFVNNNDEDNDEEFSVSKMCSERLSAKYDNHPTASLKDSKVEELNGKVCSVVTSNLRNQQVKYVDPSSNQSNDETVQYVDIQTQSNDRDNNVNPGRDEVWV